LIRIDHRTRVCCQPAGRRIVNLARGHGPVNESRLHHLRTDRLELTAATYHHINAEIESPELLACLLEAQVEPGWPPGEYDLGAQEYFRDRLQEGGEAAVGWYTWYAVRHEERGRPPLLIGAGGFLGPPGEQQKVEIGFSIVPSQRRRGYATEMTKALVAYAFADEHTRKIIAHTTPQNVASHQVLVRCSFRYVCAETASGNDLFEIVRS